MEKIQSNLVKMNFFITKAYAFDVTKWDDFFNILAADG